MSPSPDQLCVCPLYVSIKTWMIRIDPLTPLSDEPAHALVNMRGPKAHLRAHLLPKTSVS